MIRELTRAATLRLVSHLPTFAYLDSNSRLCVSPLPSNSNNSVVPSTFSLELGYFFFLILVSFLLMHAPSDVQCYFLVYVVFLN